MDRYARSDDRAYVYGNIKKPVFKESFHRRGPFLDGRRRQKQQKLRSRVHVTQFYYIYGVTQRVSFSKASRNTFEKLNERTDRKYRRDRRLLRGKWLPSYRWPRLFLSITGYFWVEMSLFVAFSRTVHINFLFVWVRSVNVMTVNSLTPCIVCRYCQQSVRFTYFFVLIILFYVSSKFAVNFGSSSKKSTNVRILKSACGFLVQLKRDRSSSMSAYFPEKRINVF